MNNLFFKHIFLWLDFSKLHQISIEFPFFHTIAWHHEPDEKPTKFRLTIKDIQQQESGTYTCTSSRGLTNSIVIIVTSKFAVGTFSVNCLDILFMHAKLISIQINSLVLVLFGRKFTNKNDVEIKCSLMIYIYISVCEYLNIESLLDCARPQEE